MVTDTSTGEQILVVEDDEFIALRLQNILTKLGYVVPVVVAYGEEAIQQAAETQPDLVLMDIHLAGEMDGIEAARQIHTRFDIPVIYLTAYANNETLQQAKFTEPFGYLLKPFKERELRSTIEVALYKHKMEQKLREQTYALGERVKELNCLYSIAGLVETPGISLERILQGIVALIPPAWQYPEITCARINLAGQEARTENFRETAWQQTANIVGRGERTGFVEVCYLEERPARNEGPFLKEERNLLNAIAGRLGRIIERVQAEEALRESEAKWRSLAETAPVTIATLDRGGTILFINRPLRTGLTPKQVIGTRIDRHLPPYEQAKIKKILESVFESGGSIRYETTVISDDGNELFYENRVAPIEVDDQIVAVTYMALDITERKQVEETLRSALEESQQRQAEITALLAGSRAVLEYREFAGAVRAMFDSCKNLTGATAGYVALLAEDGNENEVLFLDAGGLPCLVDPSLPMPIRGLREEVYRTGQTVYHNNFARSEWMDLMPEGHVRLDNVLFAPLALEGQVVGLLGLANKPNDFTEADARMASAFGELAAIALHNSRTLESLADSEERFRSVVETASDAIITIDSQGNIVFWNQTAENIFGYSAAEILGKLLTFIMPKRFHKNHQKGIERVIATRKSNIIGQTIQLAGLRKDGSEFPLELSLATWKTGKGIFFTGIIRDITEHKQAEETLQDSIEKLKIAYQQATIYARELTGEIVERKRAEEELKRLKG